MFLYRVLVSLAAPVFAAFLALRVPRGREDLSALRDRLRGPDVPEGAVWLHGASNGELASARPLIDALLAADPNRRVLVTANTVTGRDLVAGWGLARVTAGIAPLDLRRPAARMAARAAALILLENEIWPNRIAAMQARGRPVLMVAARMSERSARAWGRLPGLIGPLLRDAALIAPQDAASGARLAALGAPEAATGPAVQLKSLWRPSGRVPDAALRAAFPRGRTVLAASTHEGEERIALAAFARLHAADAGWRLVLAPRHPRRGDEIAALVYGAGLRLAVRSRGEAPDGAAVYLADTMGEMELWYALAGAALVGGSLVAKGGHTPYEPAALGCAILHGPHVANFAGEYARLDASGAAQQVEDAEGLARGWAAHAGGSPMPERAARCLRPQAARDLLDRVEAALRPRRRSGR